MNRPLLETPQRRGPGFQFLMELRIRRLEQRLRRFAEAGPYGAEVPRLAPRSNEGASPRSAAAKH